MASDGRLEMLQLINELSNADVEWDADFVGLSPTLISDAAKRLVEFGEQAISDLVAALSDPSKFVMAHVILTQISKVEYQAFPAWNGLVVDIAEDGTASIDLDQRYVLAERWKQWYRADPRPTALPSVE
jgi:hypothetical protein